MRLDAVALRLVPQPDEVVAADLAAEDAGEEAHHRLAAQHRQQRITGRWIALPEPELIGVRPQDAVLQRVGRVERAMRLDVAEELQATRANGLAVEQAGHEQVAVTLQSRPECSRFA
jgi:hypothetical protein